MRCCEQSSQVVRLVSSGNTALSCGHVSHSDGQQRIRLEGRDVSEPCGQLQFPRDDVYWGAGGVHLAEGLLFASSEARGHIPGPSVHRRRQSAHHAQ